MTPIAVFAYNRKLHLNLSLEALERSLNSLGKSLPVYLFCDAPRSPDHALGVAETRDVALEWAKKKGWNFIPRANNLGFNNITSGITELTEKYGSAIIIEDDVIVSPDFLPFMTDGLEKYEHCPEVFMISGFMYALKKPPTQSAFFLHHSFIWGWGTWKRAWEKYDPKALGWEEFLKIPMNVKKLDFNGGVFFSKMLSKTLSGKCNTWDIQWMYTLQKHQGYALYPHRSLVWNCGVGGGTHGKKGLTDPFSCEKELYVHGNLQLQDFFKPRLKHYTLPEKIELNKKAYNQLSSLFFLDRSKKQDKLVKKWRLLLKSFYYFFCATKRLF